MPRIGTDPSAHLRQKDLAGQLRTEHQVRGALFGIFIWQDISRMQMMCSWIPVSQLVRCAATGDECTIINLFVWRRRRQLLRYTSLGPWLPRPFQRAFVTKLDGEDDRTSPMPVIGCPQSPAPPQICDVEYRVPGCSTSSLLAFPDTTAKECHLLPLCPRA